MNRHVELSAGALLLAVGLVVVALVVSWLIVEVTVREERKRRTFIGVSVGFLGALVYAVAGHGPEVLPLAADVLAGLTCAALWLAIFIQTGQRAPARKLVIAGVPFSLALLALYIVR